jgi:hypothetical protein
MRPVKGILLIVAGSSLLTPAAFALGFYLYFRLNHVAVDVAAEPRAYALLAADIGLAAWLWLRGLACCRTSPAR